MTTKYNILITGVAGFLGSHLSEKLLDLGHKIIGVDNMIGGYEDNICLLYTSPSPRDRG